MPNKLKIEVSVDQAQNDIVKITLKGNIIVSLTNFGATLLSILAPNRDEEMSEITLNHSLERIIRENGTDPYYGAICGRFANRIAGGTFTLDDERYTLAINNGPNALHGGIKGFDKVVWDYEIIDSGVEFTYVSEDGEEGYPGRLTTKVRYLLTVGDTLTIDYNAMVEGKPTVVNLTNHTYFNLSGFQEDVKAHTLHLSCSQYLPVDATSIPTGVASTKDTSFDFTSERPLGPAIDCIGSESDDTRTGIDHCYVVDEQASSADTPLVHVATLRHRASGRCLVVHSSQPGVQVYTGNWLARDIKAAAPHAQHFAVALETQGFPNAPNMGEDWQREVVLRPGEVYKHATSYAFSIET